MYYYELDNVEERIESLLKESKDPEFTQYLLQTQRRAMEQRHQANLLAEELIHNERVYRNIMQQRELQMQPKQAVPLQDVRPQKAVQPEKTVQPERMAQPEKIEKPIVVAKPEALSKGNAEFTVGATVLSIVGSVFVLAALVMLGMYFASGLLKGLFMYGGCLGVMILAETFVYRKFANLGMTLSAIGMGGLYISTLVNYLVLHNYNQWIALCIMLLITLAVILLSRKRDAALYRILGMAAMYTSVFLVLVDSVSRGGLNQLDFVVVTVFAFVVNVMCLSVPVQKGHTAIQIVHMSMNTLFAVFVCCYWWICAPREFVSVAQMWDGPVFLALSILAMQLIFVEQIRWNEKQKIDSSLSDNQGIILSYFASGSVYALLTMLMTGYENMFSNIDASVLGIVCRLVSIAVIVGIGAIPMIVLQKRQEKWFSWYLILVLVAVVEYNTSSTLEVFICCTVLLLLSKATSYSTSVLPHISDLIVTIISCNMFLLFLGEPGLWIVAAGLIISVLCIHYWQTVYEIIIWFSLGFLCWNYTVEPLKLPVVMGMMFVGILIFNEVKKWKGEQILVFNFFAVVIQICCCLLLYDSTGHYTYLTYLCMLIFGIATIIVCLKDRYQMETKEKPLILAGFLTYMGLVTRTSYPIINSIVLMVIALGCVGFGFALSKKTVRVYGLILSLCVCVKLVVYDFMGANSLQKTILFFVVGVLALIISGIYMVLERNKERIEAKQVSET